MSENHKAEKPEKLTPKLKKDNKVPIVVLLVVLLLVGLVVVLNSNSKDDNKKSSSSSSSSNVATDGKAKMYLKPASQSVSAGGATTFEVWVDSGDQPVNAIQANLSYPADKFEFGSIDSKDSAFEIQAQNTGGEGSIKIARGHVGEVKGPSLIAKVTLTAKSDKGDAEIKFVDGSAVVRTTDHKDILKDKTGSTYTISRSSGRVAAAQLN